MEEELMHVERMQRITPHSKQVEARYAVFKADSMMKAGDFLW